MLRAMSLGECLQPCGIKIQMEPDCILDLQLSDDVAKPSKFTNPDHFAVLYIDEVPVPTVGNHTFMPAPRWPSL